MTAVDDAGRLDLDAVEARSAAATEGPWTTDWVDAIPLANHNVVHNAADVAVCTGWGPANEAVSAGATNAEAFGIADRHGRANATFIAAARTDVPALVAELRAAREAEARVRRLSVLGLPHSGPVSEYDRGAGDLAARILAALDGPAAAGGES